jgi:hypothetical protein
MSMQAEVQQITLPNEGPLRRIVVVNSMDTSAPTTPGIPIVAVQTNVGLTASWSPATDLESDIKYYVFGIGTVAIGDYSALASVRWWQVTYPTPTSVIVNIPLDDSTTYYFSLYAINGADIDGPIVTSLPFKAVTASPTYTPVSKIPTASPSLPPTRSLGDGGNILTVNFGKIGKIHRLDDNDDCYTYYYHYHNCLYLFSIQVTTNLEGKLLDGTLLKYCRCQHLRHA